ncbi:PREDICTED: ABSCISIC ACID-INSENSITIVE 5-like protein 5 [Nelumbo nucifera]|uniref:ABSCISIC ACID-INSENSITIVE 5-like protein 5 n=1 Tax=Nelumbo nucifera TaxID=4432 RepID=A0A1U7Z306_NELNU|nr:PREDICTED: ABSCISIC ACID-INSENSITIVE 5-like protein 5 [Nelumbo nucifera]
MPSGTAPPSLQNPTTPMASQPGQALGGARHYFLEDEQNGMAIPSQTSNDAWPLVIGGGLGSGQFNQFQVSGGIGNGIELERRRNSSLGVEQGGFGFLPHPLYGSYEVINGFNVGKLKGVGRQKEFGENSGDNDAAVGRRYRRMIKNRESAARSRARKQAYNAQLQLEIHELKKENGRMKCLLEWMKREQIRKGLLRSYSARL